MQKNLHPFIIYGANGYSGRLITRLAIERGLKPLLAGRNAEAIRTLASYYQLPYEICDIADATALNDLCLSAHVMLNCAGPFSRTLRPILEACLKSGTHYLDITGEIAVFESCAAANAQITEAGIMAMPGVGFDVVPSDCLALYLKQQLPTATHLQLAFANIGGGISHGTATTMLENLQEGGAIRTNGAIVRVPAAYKTQKINFGNKTLLAVTIPWGDVSTAYYSTGIPNIEVYTAVSSRQIKFMEWSNNATFKWVLNRQFVKKAFQRQIDQRLVGPNEKQRQKALCYLWGKVTDTQGNTATATLTTPEGYTLTALTALQVVQKVLAGNAPIGYQTPAKAYGANFILEINGVKRQDIQKSYKIDIIN